MSMVPLGGLIGSAAGVPLSQTKGGETERAQKESLTQSREFDAAQLAERAAGIGQTEQDQESSDRDADGRRPWERSTESKKQPPAETPVAQARHGKDASGQSGNQLDLTG